MLFVASPVKPAVASADLPNSKRLLAPSVVLLAAEQIPTSVKRDLPEQQPCRSRRAAASAEGVQEARAPGGPGCVQDFRLVESVQRSPSEHIRFAEAGLPQANKALGPSEHRQASVSAAC